MRSLPNSLSSRHGLGAQWASQPQAGSKPQAGSQIGSQPQAGSMPQAGSQTGGAQQAFDFLWKKPLILSHSDGRGGQQGSATTIGSHPQTGSQAGAPQQSLWPPKLQPKSPKAWALAPLLRIIAAANSAGAKTRIFQSPRREWEGLFQRIDGDWACPAFGERSAGGPRFRHQAHPLPSFCGFAQNWFSGDGIGRRFRKDDRDGRTRRTQA